MAEPAATTAGSVVALGAVTVTGTILGMHADALLAGMIAALIVLMAQTPAPGVQRTPASVFAVLAGGSFAAGIGAPFVVLVARDHWEMVGQLDAVLLRVAAGAAIGATLHLMAPALMSLLPNLVERLRGLIGGRP